MTNIKHNDLTFIEKYSFFHESSIINQFINLQKFITGLIKNVLSVNSSNNSHSCCLREQSNVGHEPEYTRTHIKNGSIVGLNPDKRNILSSLPIVVEIVISKGMCLEGQDHCRSRPSIMV